ncbi:MAG: excinuclease ABC subunit UvrA, partial [Paludibacteraceae bacterium]|nr:excinuclease ABC subunit UvrA [Paludibacteraceae bacterium]
MQDNEFIIVSGAREHNLKNVDVRIPHHSLTVITGLSGSGKSSLAFDTLYAEGQRRYLETFSAYARNFLGNIERPDVDEITGLSPVIAIEQKTTNNNPRSTVGTTTEIYDFLRLLFARAGEAYSYVTGERMVKYNEDKILDLLQTQYKGKRILLLAPLIRSRKGHYHELFENLRKKGYLTVRVDGQMREIMRDMRLDRYKNHDIEVVIDKLEVSESQLHRLKNSLRIAMEQGDGMVAICEKDDTQLKYFSRKLMCPTSGIAYNDPAPHDFSFNSPKGCCPHCRGTGYVTQVDRDKIIPDDSLSIYDGGIAPLGKYHASLLFEQIAALCESYNCTLQTPINQLPDELIDKIIYGTSERINLHNATTGLQLNALSFNGIADYIAMQADDDASATARRWAEQFKQTIVCPECGGSRLRKEALFFKIDGKNIVELSDMDLDRLYQWFEVLPDKLSDQQRQIATEIIKEIRTRLSFLLDVGLHYLSLSRASASLSGGESQRIRLATQIGSELVRVLYILDEPSIGLHPRDNVRLIQSLKRL